MRIEQFISDNSLSVADFANLIGVKSRATVYRYIGGRMPKPDILQEIITVTKGDVTANDFVKLPKMKPKKVKEN